MGGRRGRVRSLRLVRVGPVPATHRSGPRLPRVDLRRNLRGLRLRDEGPNGRAARPRAGVVAVGCDGCAAALPGSRLDARAVEDAHLVRTSLRPQFGQGRRRIVGRSTRPKYDSSRQAGQRSGTAAVALLGGLRLIRLASAVTTRTRRREPGASPRRHRPRPLRRRQPRRPRRRPRGWPASLEP